MIPSTTSTSDMQSFVLNRGASLTDQNIKVRVSFGDFYYPTPSVDSSFGYKIATSGDVNFVSASIILPTRTVWAREWSMEYVTQFYTDSNLSTPYVETDDNYYYSYSPLTKEGNPFNTLNGSETASPLSIGSDIDEENILVINGTANRRFVAKFNGSGLKYSQSARPCTGNTQ